MELFLDVLGESLVDTAKMLPFLFLAYLFIEYVENRHGERIEAILAGGGRWGSVPAALLGCVPQCGFSAISYICAAFLCGSVFICNGWRSSGRGTDLFLPYKVRMEGNFIRGRKEKENRTGDGDTDGTIPDVSVAAIRREEGA